MKRIYFLINILWFFLIPIELSNIIITNNITCLKIENTEKVNISSEKYLDLSYQDGKFYSWNQKKDDEQYFIGIFTNNEQSYLLDSFGVFWNLDFQIFNFWVVNSELAIAEIRYWQDENKKEYFKQRFFVRLEKNNLIVDSKPINSENFNFSILKEDYILAFGIGLDLIKITDGSVNHLIPDYEKGNDLTFFYPINDDSGIFVASDQYFYLLKNITGSLSSTKINIISAANGNKDVVVINDNNLVIRDKADNLFFLDISQNINIYDYKKSSKVKNFCFSLNKDTFILNMSLKNSSFEYGQPVLIKTKNYNTFIPIPTIKTINDFMFIDDTKGVFVDKDLIARTFIFDNKTDSFIINYFGNLTSFQFINQNLFFGSLKNNNFLLSQEPNKTWSARKNVQFITKNKASSNFLNNVVLTKENEIDYQNTYFSSDLASISVTDARLIKMTIISTESTRTLKSRKNNIRYDFLTFDKYNLKITFFDGTNEFDLNYKVNILDFSDQNMVTIVGLRLISYVGYAKNILYDVKSIDQKDFFEVSQFNYNYLQYIQLLIYDDTENMVIKNIYNLKNDTEVKVNEKDDNYFFCLKLVNLLNQTNWIYLGFSKNNVSSMINFWDTKIGKKLMDQAIARRYLEKDLREMNAFKIQQLINISNDWKAKALQGKSIAIVFGSIFFFALAVILFSIFYNFILDRKIAVKEVEKNKAFKNILDF